MDQNCRSLGLSSRRVGDLAAEVGADPDDLQPEDLVAMASFLDAEADEDDEDEASADDEEE